jgi:peptide chain release factor 1
MVDFNKLKKEYKAISKRLSCPEIYKDKEQYQALAKRFSFLEKLLSLLEKKEAILEEKQDLEKIISQPKEEKEVKELAKEEISALQQKLEKIDKEIEERLFEESSEVERDIIIEIRAAAGGEESALFAADLFKIYSRYIEKKGWKLEVLSSHPTELGGFKEIIFSVKGSNCFAHLKFESGVHRVQRVPVTESGGRIHTSTATVAVLIEPQEVELKIEPDDLRIDTFRASGHGGQHVNRTDSAVRITHLPTGITVSCQDERSQIMNREKAMRVLKARLLDKMEREKAAHLTQVRRIQIGTGERSEKIRTYNFPERRVTDHRINLTLYQLDKVLEGDLDLVINELKLAERKKIYESKGLG